MDTRDTIKNRKMKEEEPSKRVEELKKRKALYKRKDKLIGSNDLIVSPFANKVKVEEGENSNPVKEEVREEEEVKVEGDVKVVTVEEKVDLEVEPCVEQEGSAGTTEEAHAMVAPSALATVPVVELSSHPLGISSDPAATPTPLEEKVNYLAGVVGSLTSELKEVKEKLSKVSPEIPPPTAPATAGTNSNEDSLNMQAQEVGVNHLDLAKESALARENGTDSKLCLVCYKDVPSSSDDVHDDHALIDKQLEGVFILNKLLCIPPASLEKYLEMYPDANPASWIKLCNECGEVVEKAWRIHDEIVNASKRLKRIQEQLISKIKGSTIGRQETSGPHSEPSDIGTVITRESRRFVRENDYGHLLDRFPNGDSEACRRLTEESRRNETKTPEKSKRTQISTKVVSSEADVLRRKTRVAKFRNMISRRKKSQTKSTAKPKKPNYSVRMEGSSKLKAPPRGTKQTKARPKYSCDQCDKVLRSKNGLYCHKKAIHEKNFKHLENLRRMRQQSQKKCPHCDLTTDKYNLPIHIKRVHEKAFAVTCEICGNRYEHRIGLDRHQAAIHGICSVEGCRLEFPGDRRGLRNHQLQTHGREINVFECEDCGNLFTQASSLQKHQRNVHGS